MILHTFSVPEQQPEATQETFDAVERLRAQGYEITTVACMSVDDYWKHLMRYWAQGEDLILIEQDIVPTANTLDQLLTCPKPLCTHPYLLRNNNYSIWEAVDDGPIERFDKDGRIDLGELEHYRNYHYTQLVTYAEGSGLGHVKISADMQERIPLANYPVVNHKWSYLDTWISLYAYHHLRQLWHVHLPTVKHNHIYE